MNKAISIILIITTLAGCDDGTREYTTTGNLDRVIQKYESPKYTTQDSRTHYQKCKDVADHAREDKVESIMELCRLAPVEPGDYR
jgi:adenosine deaminase